MRHATVLAFLILVTLAASGCASDKRSGTSAGGGSRSQPPPPDASRPLSVTGTDWMLTRLGNEAALPAGQPRARPWFRLDPSDKRRVTGNTGVNLISGTYELSGGALQFGPLITTKRAGDADLIRQESGFLNALEKTATAELRGRSLTLRDAGGAALAQCDAAVMTP